MTDTDKDFNEWSIYSISSYHHILKIYIVNPKIYFRFILGKNSWESLGQQGDQTSQP